MRNAISSGFCYSRLMTFLGHKFPATDKCNIDIFQSRLPWMTANSKVQFQTYCMSFNAFSIVFIIYVYREWALYICINRMMNLNIIRSNNVFKILYSCYINAIYCPINISSNILPLVKQPSRFIL